GEYFRATDTDSLVEIYETIDALEKTRTEQRRYRQFEDFATDSFRMAGLDVPPLLIVPLILLGLDLLLSGTRLRRLP
ncbi:MAG: aerotolerance regulator BatA, partial [Phycisphaerales bacterium]